MHDKSKDGTGPVFARLPHTLLTLTGRDAGTFAQAQFMNDVSGLQPGHWQWNGWLTAKGRVVALFALLKMPGGDLWLVLPDADAQEFAAALRRFVFRSKVVVEVVDHACVSGCFGPAPQTAAAASGNALGLGQDRVELDMTGDGDPRILRVEMLGEANLPPIDSGLTARWCCHDLEHGLPRLPESQAGKWTPQQLSLERLQAFSVKKGCYPGQEIVARTHFLGKAKRGLVLVESPAALEAGAEVRADSASYGTLVSVSECCPRHLGLAVASTDAPPATFTVEGHEVRRLELLNGLAR